MIQSSLATSRSCHKQTDQSASFALTNKADSWKEKRRKNDVGFWAAHDPHNGETDHGSEELNRNIEVADEPTLIGRGDGGDRLVQNLNDSNDEVNTRTAKVELREQKQAGKLEINKWKDLQFWHRRGHMMIHR